MPQAEASLYSCTFCSKQEDKAGAGGIGGSLSWQLANAIRRANRTKIRFLFFINQHGWCDLKDSAQVKMVSGV